MKAREAWKKCGRDNLTTEKGMYDCVMREVERAVRSNCVAVCVDGSSYCDWFVSDVLIAKLTRDGYKLRVADDKLFISWRPMDDKELEEWCADDE